MINMIFSSTKYSYFLVLLLVLPLTLETEAILSLWLKNVPSNTALFCRLVFICSAIQCIDMSFGYIFEAMGDIKKNQIYSGITYMLCVPISYISLKYFHSPAYSVFIIQILITLIVTFVIKFFLAKKIIGLTLTDFFIRLVFPIFKITLISCCIPVMLRFMLDFSYIRVFIIIIISIFSVSFSVFYFELDEFQRNKIIKFTFNKISNLKPNSNE